MQQADASFFKPSAFKPKIEYIYHLEFYLAGLYSVIKAAYRQQGFDQGRIIYLACARCVCV